MDDSAAAGENLGVEESWPLGERWTVGEVAHAAHVTVRTLHHYDEVGLLVPRSRSGAGYRHYDRSDLERLQRVLCYRRLGFSLDQIAELLDGETDALEHLHRQHALLREEAGRVQQMIATLEKTMEARQMGINLTPDELFEVFGEHDPTEHADEARERWGDTDAYRQSQQRTAGYSKQDWLRVKERQQAVEARFARALAAGEPADGPEAMAAAEEHRRQIDETFYECGYEMHRGLAEMYVGDDRFAAHYDEIAPGLAAYVHDAIVANADRAERG